MRKNIFMLAVASLALIAGSSFGYEGSDGSTYIATQNAYGAALKSANEAIYLDKDCDALSGKEEQGIWAWANGGFVIEIPTRRIEFVRQDQPVDGGYDCQM
jgi:hypothetical protein